MSSFKQLCLTRDQINKIKTLIANRCGTIEESVSNSEVFEYIRDTHRGLTSKNDTWEISEVIDYLIEGASWVGNCLGNGTGYKGTSWAYIK